MKRTLLASSLVPSSNASYGISIALEGAVLFERDKPATLEFN